MSLVAPEHSVSLTRVMPAPPATIYATWTDPPAMERWLGKVAADVQVGGRYRFESPKEEGRPGVYIYTGEYLVLEPNRQVRLSFLAGEPDPTVPNPYSGEFIEIRLRELGPQQTEVIFTNGWNGGDVTPQFRQAVEFAWSEWIDRMEAAVKAAQE